VALLLSGGLDSSAITKVTDNLIQRGELNRNEIHAFIASFPGFIDDETPTARMFIKTCKHIQLHELIIDTQKTVDNLENIIQALDHPVFSFNVVVHQNIMKACKQQGVKVVLNGQGSDEAYAGYDRYISGAYLLDQLISRDGNFFEEFSILNKQNHYSKGFLLGQMFKSMVDQNYSAYLRAKYQEKSIFCLNKDFIKANYHHYKPAYQFSYKGNNFNNYLLKQIKYEGLNQILHYEDISSMSQSIEIRSPFMDYRMMEFAFSIPNELKFKGGITKIIQRDTIGKMLPNSITKNRKKIGFRAPFLDYLSKDHNVKAYVFDVLNSQSFGAKKIWKADSVKHVFERPMDYPDFPFWRFINLEVWAKVYNIKNL
ncbi:MAG TPA: asparagine synthase C-terminal domain-containing protein, partial [Haliscomenobacter sp.]|nr:asparagine synthase C-terminal domain-containing protein [Haliscomenobacter sp.]